MFICTNSPEKQGKCGIKNSEEMRRRLKEICKNEFGKDVRVNSSGCLGYCEKGIAAVIYPAGKWHFDLTATDEQKLLTDIRTCLDQAKS